MELLEGQTVDIGYERTEKYMDIRETYMPESLNCCGSCVGIICMIDFLLPINTGITVDNI